MAESTGYLDLHRSGELKKGGQQLWDIMEKCALCPRICGTNRLSGERGICGANAQLEISAHHPHFGEERPLVGVGGSGTIFFSHCNLRCVLCQNWDISHGGAGTDCEIGELAAMMLLLQERGCHNIKIVK